jgi:hypothetical protein
MRTLFCYHVLPHFAASRGGNAVNRLLHPAHPYHGDFGRLSLLNRSTMRPILSSVDTLFRSSFVGIERETWASSVYSLNN